MAALTIGAAFCYNSPSTANAITPVMDLDVEAIRVKLEALKIEHRDLDEAIAQLSESGPFNPVHLQRLKKRKLALKDLIAKFESQLLPDIIA